MVKNVCCDPLKKHTKKITKSLIPVPETMSTSLGLQAGKKICKNCHHKVVTSMKNQSASASGEPETSSESSSMEETDYVTQGTDEDTSDGFKEISVDRLNVTLPLFNITPVKTSKYNKYVQK